MASLRGTAQALSVSIFLGLTAVHAQTPVSLAGTLTDSAGTVPIAGAACKLEVAGLTATTAADGKFLITNGTAIRASGSTKPFADLRGGALRLEVSGKSEVAITSFGSDGRAFGTVRREVEAGSHDLQLPDLGSGARWLKVKAGADETVLKLFTVDGALRGVSPAPGESVPGQVLAKSSAAALYDWISCTKAGYQKAYVAVSSSDSANIQIKMLKEGTPKFSFFVTSLKVMQELAGPNGFGGDFRFGETGPGAGLRGADKICRTIAEKSMKGSSVKGWRAFLSVTSDAYGKQADAIDRVGPGPWYDRVGRLMAPTKADLVAVRPKNGDPTIQNDLPNEDGVPNHRPDPTKPAVDNHHTVTGSNASGRLQSSSATCKDWTTKDGSSANGHPAAGFSWPRPGGGTGPYAGQNWMTTFDSPGCGAKVEISGDPPVAPPGATGIGDGGGYGGFYCFALNP